MSRRALFTSSTTASTTAGAFWMSAAIVATGVALAEEQANKTKSSSKEIFSPAETSSSRVKGVSPLPSNYTVGTRAPLSKAAIAALGVDGVERLERFGRLGANWDGQGAQTLNERSVAAFSQFFRDTGLQPAGMAVFMSQEGNVAVNWLDDSSLVELEFVAGGVHYFFERTDSEDVASVYAVATFFGTQSKRAVAV